VRRRVEAGMEVVVKNHRGGGERARRGLFVEAALQSAAAACYPAEANAPVAAPLSCTSDCLTTTFYAERTLDALLDSPGTLNVAAAAAGRAVGELHGQDVSGDEWAWLPKVAGEHPPLDPIPAGSLGELSAGTVDLAARIHHLGFGALLADTLNAVEDRQVFLHGDLKFDNILATADGTVVRLIDWECAGRGMPERDLGALAGSLLTETIRRATVREAGGEARELLERVDEGTQKAWSAIAGFLTAYRTVSSAPGLDSRRMVHMTAYALLCRALSYTQTTYEFDRLPKLLVRVASNMAAQPHTFVGRFT
ncbi:phosphotransferase family protein, partial [Streptomyces chryseus]